MTGQVTPNDIAKHMWALGRELEAVTAELKELDDKSVRAKRALVLAKERAMLSSTREYQYEKKAEALIASAEEALAADLAASAVRVARAKIASIRERIEIGRTASATLREEIRLGGVH
jgi:hypothetical protein